MTRARRVDSKCRAQGFVGSLLIGAVIVLCLVAPGRAAQSFTSPGDAADALADAARAGNVNEILKILGEEGRPIVESGDEVADAQARERFVAAFDEKHAIAIGGADTAVLVIGNNDWPFPIPLVNKDGEWRFDTVNGREEILYRRIGRNELSAIQVCLAYVQAQNEYAALDPAETGVNPYATRIVSKPGKKDGLYWPTEEGEAQSPLGELAAAASAEGYKVGDKPIPYHGYYYRILKRQGRGAPGGAQNYVVRGNMIGGFGLIAHPAEYANSGVMTFMVNHDGVVYQKDLGAGTSARVRKIDVFDPGEGWTGVEPSEIPEPAETPN